MNKYVVSDIHGNAERLDELLKILKKKHRRGDFILYILGDLFDRGNESEKVISLICDNQNNIQLIKGNHESLFMGFMESPKMNYSFWQVNSAYPTITSFAEKHVHMLYSQLKDLSEMELNHMFFEKMSDLNIKLLSQFSEFQGRHEYGVYVDEISNTTSRYDTRSVSDYLNDVIVNLFPNKSLEFRQMFGRIVYADMLDDFCEIYKYFNSLNSYEIVDDKYLLVHSGFVKANENDWVSDSVRSEAYQPCQTVADLEKQSEYPMLWSRRINVSTKHRVAPNERFDNKIIVFGHTTTDRFNKDARFDTVFTKDRFGKLASVGIDGLNCNKKIGQMNCLCLDDLSQIVLTGTNYMGKKHRLRTIFLPSYKESSSFDMK